MARSLRLGRGWGWSALAAALVGLAGLFLALLLVGSSPALASEAYYRGDDLPLDNPDWMADVSGDVLLSQLSLPGTHDSMARGSSALATCQDVSIADQLQAGIRVLDIRCQNDFSDATGNYFSIWHGPLYQYGTFDQVADDCEAFLAAHPRETIVMRIRQENPPNPKCTQSFTATFEWYRDDKYPGLFADIGDGKTIPELGQVRGKVVVLQDYNYTPFWGIRYITPGSNPPFNSQDDYVVAHSKAGFDAKWSAIYRHLHVSNAGDRTNTWYVNYLSGGTLTDPYLVAGGNTQGFSAAGMNDRMLAVLRAGGSLEPPSGTGSTKVALASTATVLMDFPGPGLIQAIISLNPGVPEAPLSFIDVPPGSDYEEAIYALAEAGVITGFPDHTYRPNDPVTRQQFAKMIVKDLNLPMTGREICPFTDVPDQMGLDPWYPSKYVAVCADHAITKGISQTLFDPFGPSTHQHLITMVTRAADLPDPPADYTPPFVSAQFDPIEHYRNARKAAYAGLLDGLLGVGPDYDFFATSTRGECAQLLYNLAKRSEP